MVKLADIIKCLEKIFVGKKYSSRKQKSTGKKKKRILTRQQKRATRFYFKQKPHHLKSRLKSSHLKKKPASVPFQESSATASQLSRKSEIPWRNQSIYFPIRQEKKNVPPALDREKFNATLVGEITHFFPHIRVCVVKVINQRINLNDRLHIKRKKGKDFIQEVRSLQIEDKPVKTVYQGQLVGLKVDHEVKPGDKVYKLAS